jgi:tRNA (adenine57-N1/adenine58-N1)-methyltransferase catalytic subunit
LEAKAFCILSSDAMTSQKLREKMYPTISVLFQRIGHSQSARSQDAQHGETYDRVILDMLAPWECVEMAANVLRPGGVFLAYVATTTQLSATAEALKADGHFTEPESSETIVRGWHHEGLAVRPQQRMIGHTGFLIQSRRMAPGVDVLARRRRPAKGAYGVAEE